MTISEATIQAMNEKRCITLPEYVGKIKIRPSDERETYTIMRADGSQQSRCGWQPSARDLTRDDWIIVD